MAVSIGMAKEGGINFSHFTNDDGSDPESSVKILIRDIYFFTCDDYIAINSN